MACTMCAYMHALIGKQLGDWISASIQMLKGQASKAIVYQVSCNQPSYKQQRQTLLWYVQKYVRKKAPQRKVVGYHK